MIIACKKGLLQSLEFNCSVNYWDKGEFVPNFVRLKTSLSQVYLDKNDCLRISKENNIRCTIDGSDLNNNKHLFELFGDDILNKSVSMILSGTKFELSEKDLTWRISKSQKFDSSRFVTFPIRNVVIAIHANINCEVWIPGSSLFENDVKLDEVEEDVLYPIWKNKNSKTSDQLELDL